MAVINQDLPPQISFNDRYSYTPENEATAVNPNTPPSFVYKQYGSAGVNDRFEADLARLGLQNHPGVRLAKRAFLMTSVMHTRADGLQASHPMMVAIRDIEELGCVNPNEIIADLLHDTVEDDPRRLAHLLGYRHSPLKNRVLDGLEHLPTNQLVDRYIERQDRTLAARAIAGTWLPEIAEHVEGVSNPIPWLNTPNNNDKLYMKHIKKITKPDSRLEPALSRIAKYSSIAHSGLSKLARRAGIVTSDMLAKKQKTKGADVLNNAGENDRTSNPVLQLRTDIKHVRTIPLILESIIRRVPEDKRDRVTQLLKGTMANCQARIDRYLREHPGGPSIEEIRRRGKLALKDVHLAIPDIGLNNVDIPDLNELFTSVTRAVDDPRFDRTISQQPAMIDVQEGD